MHILISAVSSAQHPSGICRHAANLATCLSGDPVISRVTLLAGRWQVDYFRRAFGLENNTVRIVTAEVENNSYSRNWWYYRKLPRIARRCGADAVHLSFPAPVRRQSFSCPVVCSLHDLYPYDSPRNFGYMRVLFNRIFLRQCLEASDAVVCSSDFTLARLQQCAPRVVSQKAARIYQTVALGPSNGGRPEQPAIASSPFLLTVAQHRRNKNLQLLLSAFAQLRKRKRSHDRLLLVIVGAKGPETASLLSLIRRLSLQHYVHFEFALTDTELGRLYEECELMIVPSSIEGFCFPVVEALRCGSRVLCSDIPVLREVGGARCHYFSLNEEQPAAALAEAISSAMLAPAPVPFTSDRFSAKEIACQYVTLYSRLTTGVGATPNLQFAQLDAVRHDRYAS
jgi:glycosyltransferase involved in cell wall biosynthesis